MIKSCSNCESLFNVKPSRVKLGRGKYCSRDCRKLSGDYYMHKKDCLCSVCKVSRGESKGALHPSYGHTLNSEARDRIAVSQTGESNSCWKGGTGWYSALHNWVRRELGTPQRCEHCHKDGLTGSRIHWANLSGKYLKSKNDWIRLCAKCHGEYDKNEGLRIGIRNIVKERVLQ